MAEKRLFREFKQLRHTPASCSNPQIVELAPVDAEESIFKWFATIVKRDRHDSLFYYNGQWELDITVPPLYPSKPPRITFSPESKITHPNINFDTGEICLDILKDELWSPAWNLEHLVGAVLMLLDEPEPDSPLNVDLANLFRSDKLAFESAAQYTMWKYNTLIGKTKQDSGVRNHSDRGSSQEDDEPDQDDMGKNADNSRENDSPKDHDKLSGNDSPGKADNVCEKGSLQKSKSSESNSPLENKKDETKLCSHIFQLKDEEPVALEETRAGPLDDLNYIYDIGRHITQEFLKKATEVSAPRHQQHRLEAVHQLVSSNVARQIEQICLRHPSRAQSPTDGSEENRTDISFAEVSFLEKIDQQVDEIRRLQERQSLS